MIRVRVGRGLQTAQRNEPAVELAHSYPMLFHETVVRKEAGHVLRASRRVSGIPDFRLYALADGIRQFLYSQTQGVKKFLELQNPMPVQPRLFDP